MKVKQTKYSAEHPEVWIPAGEEDAKLDIAVLDKLLKEYGKGKVRKILDVGCGMGSHCYFLSEKGYICEGIEPHPKMVEYAKEHYPKINFKVGSMQDVDYNNQFDAINCIGSIIVFNRTNDETLETFNRFNKALKKEGILIIELTNPVTWIQRVKFRESFEDTENGIKTVYKEYIDEKKQTYVSDRTYFDAKTGKKVGFFSKESRMFFPQELKFFLEQAGFEVLEFFSGDSLSKISLDYNKLDKWRLLVVARKK